MAENEEIDIELEDISSFWGNNKEIVENITEVKFRPTYLVPKINGDDIFREKVLPLIIRASGKSIIQGYIDLDKEWAENEHVGLVKARKALFKKYPSPFCGRRAYYSKVAVDPRVDENGEQMMTKGGTPMFNLGGLKPPKSEKGKSWSMFISLCIFHNKEEFHWKKEDQVKKIEIENENTGEMEYKEIPDPEFKYKAMYPFVSPEVALNLTKIVGPLMRKYPDLKMLDLFIITDKINEQTKGKYKGNFNMNMDDFCLMTK